MRSIHLAQVFLSVSLACVPTLPLQARISPSPASSVPRHASYPVTSTSRRSAKTHFAFPAMPSTFVTLRPTTTLDIYDPNDLIAPGTGRLSLREAFLLANRLNVEAAIVLERGAVYRLERCGPFKDSQGERNELTHTANKTLTVNGNSATIFQDCDGAGVIVQQAGTELLNLVDFTLQGGRSRHSPAGGVWSSGVGEVRITNMVVIDNSVSGVAESALQAGGVSANGMVIISGATFAENRAAAGAGAAAAAGSIKAIKSSFFHNSGTQAGALAGGSLDGTARSAAEAVPPMGPPGGAFTGLTPNGLTLIYSTISDNSSPALLLRGGELTGFGSWIGSAGAGPLCNLAAGHAHSLGHNASSNGDCGLAADPVTSQGGAALVSVTGMKGVQVLAAAAKSELLDAIPPSECFPASVRAYIPVYSGASTDQLGVPRPQGKGCDIGAVESLQGGTLGRKVGIAPVTEIPLALHWIPPQFGAPPHHILVVDTEEDVVNTNRLSLRDAFARVNQSDADTIRLAPGRVYRLSRCAAPQSAVDNDTNDLLYTGTHPLTIEGNGATVVQTCDGSGVVALYSDEAVVLKGLTVSGGRSVIHPGGGIYMAGSGDLRLEQSWVTDNATVAAGGGIASFGDVTLLNSTVSDNHSSEVGGGIIATADVTAINSSLFNNTADLAIGAIGNHSGKLVLIFTTISHNSAPNVAVGSIDALGSIVADYLSPPLPPGFEGPPPGGALGRPPAGPATGAAQPGGANKPVSNAAPPGGFPPPANCDVQTAGALLDGNLATDHSCGFAVVEDNAGLVPDRANSPQFLRPTARSPALHLLPVGRCEEYRNMLDQMGAKRFSQSGCTSGAIALAKDDSQTGQPTHE